MQNPITQILSDKEAPEFKSKSNKFFDYPIQFQGPDNIIRDGYLQDARITYDDPTFKMELVVLVGQMGGRGQLYAITKTCIAPPDCDINWDTLHCAQTVRYIAA